MTTTRLLRAAAGSFAGGLALSVCMALAVANPPAARAAGPAVLQIGTVPLMPDARIILDGLTHVTGPDGTLTISTFAGRHRIGVLPPSSPPHATAVRFTRWLDGIAQPTRFIGLHQGLNNMQVGFQVSHPIRVRFSNEAGRPVPMSVVTSITMANSLGQRYTFAPQQPPRMLAANRIVRDQFGLHASPIRYSVREVIFRGANVVYGGSQNFFVHVNHTWTVRLLLFPMHIEVRDALFGFAVGSAVRVRLIGGSSKTVTLGPGHAVTLRGMPRATYQLVAKGPGIGLSSPATLTKPLEARLLLLSWVDFAAVGMFAVLFVVGLPLLGGRIRRRSDGRRLLAWHSGHPAEQPVQAQEAGQAEQPVQAEQPDQAERAGEPSEAPADPVLPAPVSLAKDAERDRAADSEVVEPVPQPDGASRLSWYTVADPSAAREPWHANEEKQAAPVTVAVANGHQGSHEDDEDLAADQVMTDAAAGADADTDPSQLVAEQVMQAARLAWER